MIDKKRSDEFSAGKERIDEIKRRLGDAFGKQVDTKTGGGFFAGLGNVIEQLGKLAEQAEKSGGTSSQSGEFNVGGDSKAKGVYGFTIKTGLGEKGVKVEPFGNVRKDEEGKLVAVHEVREPLLDLFDEPDRVLIVAEVPGIEEENVQVEIHDDILIISTEKGQPKYRKEVLLPGSFSAEQLSFHCRNGILEIELLKGDKKAKAKAKK